jgi:MFS family permease
MPTIARDLGVSHAMGGIVWGAAPLGIAIASPFGGAAVDRFGARRVAAIAMVAGALACAARAWASSAWGLAVCMLLFGLHIGFVAPSIPKALAGHVPLTKLGRANGIALLAYTLGTAATVLTAQAFLAPLFGGWRGTMIAAGGAMAVVAVLWFVLSRDRIAHMPHAGLLDVLRLAKNRDLVRVASMHFLLFGGYLALLGILPRALTDGGLPPARVGVAVASWLTIAGIANGFGPWLSDRIGRRRPLFLAGAAIAGTALGAFAIAPPGASLACLGVAAIGGGCIAPLLFAMPAEIPGVGPARAGAALGLLMLIGQAGGFLLPALTGVVAQTASIPTALGVLALAHLAIVIPAFGLRDARRAAGTAVASPMAEAA